MSQRAKARNFLAANGHKAAAMSATVMPAPKTNKVMQAPNQAVDNSAMGMQGLAMGGAVHARMARVAVPKMIGKPIGSSTMGAPGESRGLMSSPIGAKGLKAEVHHVDFAAMLLREIDDKLKTLDGPILNGNHQDYVSYQRSVARRGGLLEARALISDVLDRDEARSPLPR